MSFSERTKDGRQKLGKRHVKRLLGAYQFIVPYKGAFFIGLLCLLCSGAVLLAFPFFTGKLIDTATGKNDSWFDNYHQIILALIGVLFTQSILSFFRIYFFSRVIEKAASDMRNALYKKYVTLNLTFYDGTRIGKLISRITSDIALLQNTFSVTLSELIRQVVILILGLVLLFITHSKLTLFMLAIFPILVLTAFSFGRYIRKFSRKTQDNLADANVIVEESLHSIQMVKAFTNEKYEIIKYRHALKRAVDSALKSASFRGLFTSFIIFSIFGGIVLVLWYGSYLVMEEKISVGDLTSFIIYTLFIGGAVGSLGDVYGSIQKAVGAYERIEEIFEINQQEQILSFEGKKLNGNIQFDHVYFSYPSRKNISVINGVDFEIKSGEKIALVGHSGAGKSTIIQLLLHFYSADKGEIKIDGENINSCDLHQLRSSIGIVPQEVLLFGGSIRENIRYGKSSATDEEVYSAAQKANAIEFIERFPENFNTLVGERGIKLSGGQKQRIAIARAILKNPPILILDEATNALDSESEKLIQQALDKLMKNRTTLVIAHRLTTVRKLDKILVLEKGKIIEQGTHQNLVENKRGTYYNLVQLQFGMG